VDANPFLIEMLGFPYEEFVGKELWELGFFKDVAANKENFLELQRKEYIRYEDLPLETSDERKFYVEFVSNVYMVDDHKVVQCNIRDITERKQAADALSVSETRYHRLFEAARDGILILDAETGMILDVNSFLIELLGFSQKAFLGKALWELGLFKDIAANKVNFLELQQQEYIKYENLPLETSDGRVIQVEFVSYVYLLDQHKFIQCNIRDITGRKQADEKLKVVNNDLKQAQSVAHLGNWKWDLKTSTVEWSDEMYNIFGIDKDSDTGRLGGEIAKVIHPDDLHIVLPENAERFAKNKPQEYRIIRPKDGEIRHIWAQAGASILDAQGNPLFMTGIAQDITERKLAEEMLKKSEKQFRLLFEEMFSGVAVHEIICDESGTPADFRFLSVNTTFEKMTGLDASNILGKTVLEVIPETESSWIERYGKVALTGEPIQFEDFAEALGKYYEVRAYRPEHGKFVTIINDITERKQAEINLRESEANLSALIENTDGSIWTVDEQYRLIVGNEEFHRNTSAASKRRLETRESVLLPSFPLEVNAEWQRYYDRALQGERFAIETQTHFRETLRQIEYRFSPIRVADGEIRGVTVYGRDITERKQAEDELRVALIKYKTLFDCFPLGITVSDGAGNILETNSTAGRLLSVSEEEQTRRGIGGAEWKIVRSDGTPMPPEEFASVRALKEKRVIENVEMGIVNADNSITWISVNAAPLPVEGYGVAVTYGDITERKQAEEALLESEIRFHQMFEKHNAIMLLIEPQSGLILDANQSAAEFYGYEKSELCTMNINEIN
jgi:PAS domain S-box-containing protein